MPAFHRRSMIRLAAVGAAALALGFGVASCKKNGETAAGDMSMGSADAAVTVVEYASVTCSHCARWNEEVFPAFKAKYIDTGKVRYVFREFPTPPMEVATAGFLVARCAGDDKYFQVVDAIMRSQQEMFGSGDTSNARPVLLRIARSAGLTEQQFDACVTNEDAIRDLEERVQAGVAAGVDSTPYFQVDGRRVGAGEASMADFDAAIQPLLAGG
ncbi:MAG TPA: DsbA family protein [Caulobacteraceae bacterium]|jgi:protein-disulfide isomerase